jgi:hypothetical protein
MANRNFNGGVGGGALVRCSADDEVAACDALPPLLRALIKGSFVNTRATTVLAEWLKFESMGVPEEVYADWYAQRLAVNLAKSCVVAYGVSHPQATPPSFDSTRGGPEPPNQQVQMEQAESRARAERRAAQINLDDL